MAEVDLYLDDFKIKTGKILYISQQLERDHPKIIKLDLSNKKLSNENTQKICYATRRNTKLQKLYLNDNLITDRGAEYIALMIKKNSSLTM
jgi:hypothetical protein